MKSLLICLATLLCVPCLFGQPAVADNFETIAGWQPLHSHGDACNVQLSSGKGKTGNALVMSFSFAGHMGSVSAAKTFRRELPPDFQLVLDVRGSAPPNNFIIRIYDSLDNVWVVNLANYSFPKEWTKLTLKKWQLPFGWGPSGGGNLRYMDRIEFIVDVVEGGSGELRLDNFAIEPIDTTRKGGATIARASSSAPGGIPMVAADGMSLHGWHSASASSRQWVELDFGNPRDLGGVVIEWDPQDFATSFDVQTFAGTAVPTMTAGSRHGQGARSIVPLHADEVRKLRIVVHAVDGKRGVGIRSLTVKGPEFALSPNEFFHAVASESPEGSYPAYFLNRQSYWTVVGVPEDRCEAMINEQGLIEVDRHGFSLEPFLYLDGKMVSWADVSLSQSLEQNLLPIPSVAWSYGTGIRLHVTPLAVGEPGKSELVVHYAIQNAGSIQLKGSFFVALRPFQVNPPWQTFTIVGGVSQLNHLRCGDTLYADNKIVIPFTRPNDAGACAFADGDVTDFLRRDRVPPSTAADDPKGYASGAIRYAIDLAPGDSMSVVLAVPFHHGSALALSGTQTNATENVFSQLKRAATDTWKTHLGNVEITLPPQFQDIANTAKSTIAYILINADSVALQPGSRSYERSWIRDGSLMSTALLQMGVNEPVRKYLEWYGTYQSPEGAIPAVVDDRGPEAVPEHDSHGQYIYAIMQYFRFTRDTAWLRTQWPRMKKTVSYIQALRSQRKTAQYREGNATEEACFGLVPESISHEGYCPKPMHSYWDDFFALRGLKDAAEAAEILGDSTLARRYAAERDDLRMCLYKSMDMVAASHGANYIPGCVEQGEFGGLSATVGITPVEELGFIPDALVRGTFERCAQEFKERKSGATRWESYLPYEFRYVGTFVYLGWRQLAGEMLSWYMQGRRPRAWNGWGEVVWRDSTAPRCIGDMPHAWAGSDFIRSFRSMLAYERERDSTLILGAGIMEPWIEGPGLHVQNLPTYYGSISYSVYGSANAVDLEISGAATPPGGIIVKSPRSIPVKLVKSDRSCMARGDEVQFSGLPVRIRIEY